MNDSIPSSSGIYKITCTANKKIYIGSTIDLQRRQYEHFTKLRLNKHINTILQNAWNKYGESAFTFEVLEIVLPMSLTAREQYWLNKLKPFGKKGFNINSDAASVMSGRKHSPETLEKMRQSHLGKKMSPEAIEKTRQANLGRKQSPEHIEKMRQIHLGKKRSPEVRAKLSQAQLGKHHNLGRKASLETREKMRQIHLGKKMSPESIEKMKIAYLARKRDAGGKFI